MCSASESDWLQCVTPTWPMGPFRAAIFDFDGTLSLFRRNWQQTMIPMMVEILKTETDTEETPESLSQIVEDFVMRLNGKQTIFQMIQLCEEIKHRGGSPRDPLEYKQIYHDQLWERVRHRIAAVQSGEVPAEQMTVPGSQRLLEELRRHDIMLYLASGTDRHYVINELKTLGLDSFFGPHVYGALDDYRRFSKAMVIQQIISECGLAGEEIVAFGDGFVEIEETRKVGGLAVGVASDEEQRSGINIWKRDRLIQAGAHWIVADYVHDRELVERLIRVPRDSVTTGAS